MGTQGGYAFLGLNIGTVSPGVTYGSGLTTILPGVFHPAPLTGTLAPGSYFVSGQGSALFGAEARGEVFLRLTAVTASPVPDSGSTVMILGMVLCALGGFARRFKPYYCLTQDRLSPC
jgi:hypothetical protein